MRPTEKKKLIAWMKKHFMPERTKGWNSTIHVCLKDGEPFTVDVNRRTMNITMGLVNEPLAEVSTDCSTLLEILKGSEPLDLAIIKGTLSADNMVEIFKFITVFNPVIKLKAKAPLKREGKATPERSSHPATE